MKYLLIYFGIAVAVVVVILTITYIHTDGELARTKFYWNLEV